MRITSQNIVLNQIRYIAFSGPIDNLINVKRIEWAPMSSGLAGYSTISDVESPDITCTFHCTRLRLSPKAQAEKVKPVQSSSNKSGCSCRCQCVHPMVCSSTGTPRTSNDSQLQRDRPVHMLIDSPYSVLDAWKFPIRSLWP